MASVAQNDRQSVLFSTCVAEAPGPDGPGAHLSPSSEMSIRSSGTVSGTIQR